MIKKLGTVFTSFVHWSSDGKRVTCPELLLLPPPGIDVL